MLQSNFDIEIRTVIENEYEKGKAYSCEADFYLHGKDAASKEFISKLAKKSAALREIIIFGSDLNTISMPTDGSKDEFIRVAKGILTMIKLAETPNLPSPLDFLKATGLDVAWLSAPVGLYAYNKIGFEATTAIGSYFDELNKSAPVIVNEESFKTKVHFTSSLKNVDGSLRQVVAARFDDNLGAIPLQFSALKNRYLNGKNLLMQIMPQLEGANSKETRG